MDLDPRRLLVLQAVAETGSLAEAARALGHTASAVSQQLARLERETGTTLAERGSGRIELTAAGRILARAGEQLAATLAEAERDLAAVTGRAQGPVTIGAVPGAVASLVADTVAQLAASRPDLLARAVEAELEDGLRGLRMGHLDLFLLTDDRDTAVPVPPGCQARALVEDGYRLVVPDDWELPANPADLDGRPWIGAPPESARGRCFARLAAVHGITPSVEHVARNPYSLQAMAAARLGAFVAPRFFVDDVANVRATELPVPGDYLVRVLYRSSPVAEAAARACGQAALARAEQRRAAGLLARDPIVRRIADPSPGPAAPGPS